MIVDHIFPDYLALRLALHWYVHGSLWVLWSKRDFELFIGYLITFGWNMYYSVDCELLLSDQATERLEDDAIFEYEESLD